MCKSCRTCFMFYCMFYFTCDHHLTACMSRTRSELQTGKELVAMADLDHVNAVWMSGVLEYVWVRPGESFSELCLPLGRKHATVGQHPREPTVHQSHSITTHTVHRGTSRYTRTTPGCTDSVSVSQYYYTHSTPRYVKVHSDNTRVYRQCISLTVLLHTVHPGTSRYTRTTPGCTNSETFKSQQSKTRHRYHGTIFT